MAIATRPSPVALAPFDGALLALRSFTPEEFCRLHEIGVVRKDEPVDFTDGYVTMRPGCGTLDRAVPAVVAGCTTFVRRFTVEEYHRMIAAGILDDDERVELLEGMITLMSPQEPPHVLVLGLAEDLIPPVLPKGWVARFQVPITTAQGEPEPDIAVVRGPRRRYLKRHPRGSDIALIGEIADSSLKLDRQAMAGIYARERIQVYWIVNIPDVQVEVHTQPAVDQNGVAYYRSRQDYGPRDLLPVMIQSRVVAKVRVRDQLP
jgi:Uma2 family endonuclease